MQYIVHGRHATHVDVPAQTAEGHEIVGKMPAVIVELVPVDPWGKSITHIAITPDKESTAKADALFQVDAVVEISFSAAKE